MEKATVSYKGREYTTTGEFREAKQGEWVLSNTGVPLQSLSDGTFRNQKRNILKPIVKENEYGRVVFEKMGD